MKHELKPSAAVFDLAMFFVRPAIAMIGFAQVHSYYDQVPAFGYWICFWFTVVWAGITDRGIVPVWIRNRLDDDDE